MRQLAGGSVDESNLLRFDDCARGYLGFWTEFGSGAEFWPSGCGWKQCGSCHGHTCDGWEAGKHLSADAGGGEAGLYQCRRGDLHGGNRVHGWGDLHGECRVCAEVCVGAKRGGGAVQRSGRDGDATGQCAVHGVGSGPEIAFSPAPVVSVDTTTEPVSVAVDGTGELFVTDSGTGSLIEAPPTPGEPELPGTTGSLGAVLFTGLTIDAGGDLFVGDVYHARERMGGDSRRMTAGRP